MFGGSGWVLFLASAMPAAPSAAIEAEEEVIGDDQGLSPLDRNPTGIDGIQLHGLPADAAVGEQPDLPSLRQRRERRRLVPDVYDPPLDPKLTWSRGS